MEEDTDSLFGTPPPSPSRGRSTSPTLALPTCESQDSSAKNVGTIALPGSHLYSELPVTPIALSLSRPVQTYSTTTSTPEQSSSKGASPPSIPNRISASTPSSSRASSAAPTVPTKRKATSKQKSSGRSVPRPAMTLPDPSEPLPPNFLRNHSELLGTAGLVAGVKPGRLPNPQNRGSTPSNPIVVDDEDQSTPTIGRTPDYRQVLANMIDPRLLPTPSTQDIVAMLIGQKDIFPVLDGILRLIAGSHNQVSRSPPPPRSFHAPPAFLRHHSSDNPPTKKRRLNKVPAGAVDWDVPYPFEHGEGPDAYQATWERDRGRELLSQLMNLIKQATKRAATKKYLQQLEESRRRVKEPTRQRRQFPQPAPVKIPHTREQSPHSASAQVHQLALESIQAGQTPSPHPMRSTSPTSPQSMPTPPPPPSAVPLSETQLQTPFDQLITSLLTATPQHFSFHPAAQEPNFTNDVSPSSSASTMPKHAVANLDVLRGDINQASSQAASSESSIDQTLFNNWMDVFQNFPVPAEGLAQPCQTSTQSTDFDMLLDFNFGTSLDGTLSWDVGQASKAGFDSYTPHVPDILPSVQIGETQQTPGQLPPGTRFEDLIDPILLNMNQVSHSPQPSQQVDFSALNLSSASPSPDRYQANDIITQFFSPSPMPSASPPSSYGEAGPLTPNSVAWDYGSDRIGNVSRAGGKETSVDTQMMEIEDEPARGSLANIISRRSPSAFESSRVQTPNHGTGDAESLDSKHPISTIGKGKGKAIMVPHLSKGQGIQPTPERSTNTLPELVLTVANSASSSHSGEKSRARDSSHVSSPTSTRPSSRSSNPAAAEPALKKEALLKLARERRKWLSEELIKARTQLWEVTVEQGVLSEFIKGLNSSINDGNLNPSR